MTTNSSQPVLYITTNLSEGGVGPQGKAEEIAAIRAWTQRQGVTLQFVSGRRFYNLNELKFPTAYINMGGYPNEPHYRYLRYLELNGVRSINKASDERVAQDKMLSLLELKSQGIPVVDTISLGSLHFVRLDQIEEDVKQLIGFPCVIKYTTNGRGFGIVKIADQDSFRDILELLFCTDAQRFSGHSYNNFIVQKFVPSTVGRGLRVFVVDGQVVGTIERVNPTYWKNNLSYSLRSGGQAHAKVCEAPRELVDQSVKIAAILKTNFVGIDYHMLDHGYIFNEINCFPDFSTVRPWDPDLKILDQVLTELMTPNQHNLQDINTGHDPSFRHRLNHY